MAGIFLNDQRDPERPVTYSAERALLVREGMEARLVMLEGVALTPRRRRRAAHRRALRPVRLRPQRAHPRRERPRAAAVGIPGARAPAPRPPEMLASGRYSRADFVAEGHYKLSLPLLAMIYPMIALVTLLAGGYRRSGFGRRVVVAIGGGGAPAGPDVRRPRPGAGARRALAAHVPAGAARRRLRRACCSSGSAARGGRRRRRRHDALALHPARLPARGRSRSSR